VKWFYFYVGWIHGSYNYAIMWNNYVMNYIIVQMNGVDDIRVTVKRKHLYLLDSSSSLCQPLLLCLCWSWCSAAPRMAPSSGSPIYYCFTTSDLLWHCLILYIHLQSGSGLLHVASSHNQSIDQSISLLQVIMAGNNDNGR